MFDQLTVEYPYCGCKLHVLYYEPEEPWDFQPEHSLCPSHGGLTQPFGDNVQAWELHHADNKPVYRVRRGKNKQRARKAA